MRHLLFKTLAVLAFCLLAPICGYSGEADLIDIDDSCKFDKSSVRWMDMGRQIIFTYMALPRDQEEQKQFDDYYKVSGSQRVLYDIKIHREGDNFFEITRTWLTDLAGNVIYESAASQGKKLVSASPRIKKCYELIIKDYIGLSADDAYAIATEVMGEGLKNIGDGYPYLQVAAERGKEGSKKTAAAQCILGLCYLEGHGIERDYTGALHWLQKSSEGGNTDAAYFLGQMYKRGNGVTTNKDMAIKYFKIAAEKDNIASLKELAICYFNGDGVNKSVDKGLVYLKRAAQLGDTESQEYVAKVEKQRQQENAQAMGAVLGILGNVLKVR